VRQAWVHINSRHSEHILILSGDHIYRMDYAAFSTAHNNSGADISIAVQPVTREEAPELGVLKIDAKGRIVKFVEKPKTAEALEAMRCDTTMFGLSKEEAEKRPFLASMGVYLFNTPVMNEMLHRDVAQHDFGKNIVPQAIAERHVNAFCFQGYWADIGTVGAFYEANLDLVRPEPKFNFFDPAMPIYTHARPLPGAKVNDARVQRSILCEGVVVEGGTVSDSILGVRAHVSKGAIIENSIVMGADYYQTAADTAPRIGIGEGAVLRRAIVDKDASVGAGARLINAQNLTHYDDPNQQFFIRDGILLVTKGGVIPAHFEF